MDNIQLGRKRARIFRVIIFSIICVAVNLLGSVVAGMFDFPLYLDSVGTIVAACVSGYLPGIAVGLITNCINSAKDSTSIYYSALNVLIAMCASFFNRRGLLKKIPTTLLFVLALAAIGGGLGSILTLNLFGFAGDGVTADLANQILNETKLPMFVCQVSADLILDIVDKMIVVAVVLIILKLMPDKLCQRLHYEGWQQTPLSEEQKIKVGMNSSRAVSLKTKILMLLTVASVLVALAGTSIGYFLYKRATIDDHRKFAQGASGIAATLIDGDKVEEYIDKGEEAEGYLEVKDKLYKLRDSSPVILYVYVYKIDNGGCRVVFDLDTEDVKGSKPGDIVPFDASFAEVLPDLREGKPIEPRESNDQYGWLLSSYTPVYDSTGKCVCYAAADISMDDLKGSVQNFLVRQISLFIGFFLMVMAVGLWLAEYNIIYPVNSIAAASRAFVYNSESAREDSVQGIKALKINTGDEIENLYYAITHTTQESINFVADIQKKTKTISNMQVALIYVLADIVENRDQNTGDHIRKTAAYVRVILEELRAEGIYTDILTDEYIKDVADSAPLHDIGKIRVPDAILKSTSKLSDEERYQIQMHTTWGAEIVDQAIKTVPDSEFLKYARELAWCHHEKWNGEGYPRGLKGDEIPMPARAMAIADVFDALVSRRSYKEPFPFDKAMQIISEGAGSHFDPVMVKAFENVRDKVKAIAEDYEHYNG